MARNDLAEFFRKSTLPVEQQLDTQILDRSGELETFARYQIQN